MNNADWAEDAWTEDEMPPLGDVLGPPDDEHTAAQEADGPPLAFASTDEFVREFICPVFQRRVGSKGRHWKARWWESPEAIIRLEALWRAFEHHRLNAATGMTTWLRDADYQLGVLMSDEGPFGRSDERSPADEPLPYEPPPPGMFPEAPPHRARPSDD